MNLSEYKIYLTEAIGVEAIFLLLATSGSQRVTPAGPPRCPSLLLETG